MSGSNVPFLGYLLALAYLFPTFLERGNIQSNVLRMAELLASPGLLHETEINSSA